MKHKTRKARIFGKTREGQNKSRREKEPGFKEDLDGNIERNKKHSRVHEEWDVKQSTIGMGRADGKHEKRNGKIAGRGTTR